MLKSEVVDKAIAGVVSIITLDSEGSGVVVSSEPGLTLVITNAHVVGDHSTVVVDFTHGSTVPAPVLGVVAAKDEALDLALINVSDGPHTSLTLAEWRTLSTGFPLYAVGFPRGRLQSQNHGAFPSVTITSGFKLGAGTVADAHFGHFGHFVGGVNPGNSGGPAIDTDARVRGIVTKYWRGTEFSAVVPSEAVVEFLSRAAPQLMFPLIRATPSTRLRPGLQAPPPDKDALVLVSTPAGYAVGVIIGRTKEGSLVATDSALFDPNWETTPVKVSHWADGTASLAAASRALLWEPTEELALVLTPIVNKRTLPLSDDPESLVLTQPISAWELDEKGHVSQLHGTVSAVWYGVESAERFKVDLGIDRDRVGGLVFDMKGRIIGLSLVSIRGTNITTLVPVSRLRALLHGHLRGAALSVRAEGRRCAVAATVSLNDPLSTVSDVQLLYADRPNYQPAWRADVPPMGAPVATASVTDGVAHLKAIITPCLGGKVSFQFAISGARFVERTPTFTVSAGAESAEVQIRGRYFSGTEPLDLQTPEPPPIPPLACEDVPLQTCHLECERGNLEACFRTGTQMLQPDRTASPQQTAVGLLHLQKACRAGLARACAAQVEVNPRAAIPALRIAAYPACRGGDLVACTIWALHGGTFTDLELQETLMVLCLAGVPAACERVGLPVEGPTSFLSLPEYGDAQPTTNEPPRVRTQRRVDTHAPAPIEGNIEWKVERPDMLDVGVVFFSMPPVDERTEALLKRDAEGATRCVLVHLSYADRWMKQPRGASHRARVATNTVDGPDLVDAKAARCIASLSKKANAYGVSGLVMTIVKQ